MLFGCVYQYIIQKKFKKNVMLKKISIENLTYWNVELQEPYFSYIEAFEKREEINKN